MNASATRLDSFELLAAFPDALVRIRRDGVVVEAINVPDGAGLEALEPGCRLDEVLAEGVAARFKAAVLTAVDEGRLTQIRFRDADFRSGGSRSYEARCARLSHHEVVAFVRDISDQERAEAALSAQTMLDSLTGLANRPLVTDRIAQALRRAWRKGGTIAVVTIDLDQFKDVNDALGYEQGHVVLSELAKRLVAVVRPTDTVARVGSDEFVVLIDGLDEMSEVVGITESLREAIQAPGDGPRLDPPISACMGVSVAVGGDVDAATMISHADTALRHAKSVGRGTVELFDPALQRALERRLDLRRSLRHGLDRGEMFMHYQPIVAVATGEITGLEAFLRWSRPGFGLIPANEFLPVAEEAGLITDLGTWALRTACADAATWRQVVPGLMLSVNIAPAQLVDEEFVPVLATALFDCGMDPGHLTIEVTEAALLDRDQTAVSVVRSIKELGVRIALDDFGTGYSSLTHLRRFPVNQIKIDRSFTTGLTNSRVDERIVESAIALAHAVGYEVVAEGVETAEQLALLGQLGCDKAQGYLLGAPRTAAETSRMLVESAVR